MTGSIAVSQCGHTPNRPGHHGTVVARTVGTVAISCNALSPLHGMTGYGHRELFKVTCYNFQPSRAC